MTQCITVVESVWTRIPIDRDQAELLSRIGRELASAESWWGESREREADLEERQNRTVIGLRAEVDGSYSVLFREVVGVVVLGQARIQVRPKIPRQHFNYIASSGKQLPRVSSMRATLMEGEDLASLVARWLVESVEQLLRGGLAVDYNEEREELTHVRGRLDSTATSLASLAGRVVGICEFEELGTDTPLNRLLKAACTRVASFAGFDAVVRKRARLALLRMEGVGPLRFSDYSNRVDRLTRRYKDALTLAMLVLRSSGIDTAYGRLVGSAFLISTPKIIEEGLRAILAEGLPDAEVCKRKLQLGKSGLSLSPDLVFRNGEAVGDIKYRLLGQQWDRANLYQAVSFAAGFKSKKCLVVGFKMDGVAPLPCCLLVGEVEASALAWNASEHSSPSSSAMELIGEVARWLAGPISENKVA
jgi:hypothetical protein